MEAKRKLVGMTINSVHLVDKGDNPEAHIALFKRSEADPEIEALAKATAAEIDGTEQPPAKPPALPDSDVEKRSFLQKMAEFMGFKDMDFEKDVPTFDNLQERDAIKGLLGDAYKLTDTYLDSLDRAIWDAPSQDEDPKSLIATNTNQFKSSLDELVGSYAKRRAELAKKGAAISDEVLKRKKEVRKDEVEDESAEDETEPTLDEETSSQEETPDPEEGSEEVPVTQEQIDAQLSEVENSAPEVAKEIRAKMAASENANPAPTTEEAIFEKALQELPEGLRPVFKAQREQLAEMKKREEARSYIEKTRSLNAVPVETEEFGKVLHRIAKGQTTEEDETFVLDMAKNANAMLGHSAMLESAGLIGTRKNTPGTVEHQVFEKARQIAKDKGISEEAALGQVPNEDPALYAKYEERRTAEARGEVV